MSHVNLSKTREGGKEEGIEGCFMGNGFREGEGLGGAGGKQLQCPPPPPSNLMDNISGEFALVINGHSLVRLTRPQTH